jgi:hypothetical protein
MCLKVRTIAKRERVHWTVIAAGSAGPASAGQAAIALSGPA